MKLLKLIYRNFKYYTIGIPAWALHELMHYIAILLVWITYPFHWEKLWDVKVTKFVLNTKQCHLSISYNTYSDGWWIGIFISIAPRLLYIILPLIVILFNNAHISIYFCLLMTRQSLDMSFQDKKNIIRNLQCRKKLQ